MRSNQKIEICILAAGLGKRMKSDQPKVLQPIAGEPMLEHLLRSARALAPLRIHVVTGKGASQVEALFAAADINFVHQAEQKGTGHAVMQVLPHLDEASRLLILLGDTPLITPRTMQRMVDADCDLGVLTADVADPHNYGRVIRGSGGELLQIVEERDADEQQQRIGEINTGVMVTDSQSVKQWLDRIDTNNAQQEYLLTDIVDLAVKDGKQVHAIKAIDATEALGVNDFEQLATLEREHQRRLARELMRSGIHLIDPARIDIRGKLTAGAGSRIDVNCVFEGECTIGKNVVIGPNCWIKDTLIDDNAVINPNSVIEGAVIGSDCSIGPFARLRPGARLERDVHIGNFVEVKQSRIGEGTKASHLTYIGDATIGAGVNIGAGTITCNYDGIDKHETHIGDKVFVGSNTALVAPITISEGAWIAAGSTITRDVAPGNLAIARGRQRDIEDWAGPQADGKSGES
ncbi:MAG: bifunctional UDP-N-acetylglucosamine diphosphorylase/glucosamine-1-phosphate N-acetyltransferase GlmU [Pseudomonadales bacterium]